MKNNNDELRELLDGLKLSRPAPENQYKRLVKSRKEAFKNIQKMRGNYYGILSLLAMGIFFNRLGISISYIKSMILSVVLVSALSLSALSFGGYYVYKVYSYSLTEEKAIKEQEDREQKKEVSSNQIIKKKNLIKIQKTSGEIIRGEVLKYDKTNYEYTFRTAEGKIIKIKSDMIYKMGNFKE